MAADAKYFDTVVANYALNTTGGVKHLNIVVQGTTVISREGKSWINQSLHIRGYVAADIATTVAHTAMYIIWDKQPNKVLASITDIFDTVNSHSFAKRENKGRFLILKKWIHDISGNITTPGTGKEIQKVEKYMRLPAGLVTQMTSADTTGIIGNTINGALLFVHFGQTVAGTGDANASLGFRLGFSDHF